MNFSQTQIREAAEYKRVPFLLSSRDDKARIPLGRDKADRGIGDVPSVPVDVPLISITSSREGPAQSPARPLIPSPSSARSL